MSTMEKLFVQIFERKNWIIDQAKHQIHLFDQHLASKLLIEGIAPPPWLWSSDPSVLGKQELVSGIPFPCRQPVIPFTGSHCSVFDRPVARAHNEELPGLCAELRGFNEGLDAGDEVSVLPQCRISNAGCASDGVPQDQTEEDPSVTSPEDQRDARISDIYHDPALSLARGAGVEASILPQCPISNAGCASNGFPQDQREENPSVTSPEDHRYSRISDLYHDPALSLARVQRSKSRQRALAIRNSAKKSCSQDKNNVNGYAGGTIGPSIFSLQSDHVDEMNFVKPSDTSGNTCAVDVPKLGELRIKEKSTATDSGRITRSRSSGQQHSSFNVSGSACIVNKNGGALADSVGISTQQSNHVNQPLELVDYSNITNNSGREREAKVGDYFSKEKGSSIYCGRTTRSRSASQQLKCLNKLLKLEHSSDSAKEDGVSNSMQQPKHVDEMMEVVKYFDIIDGSCEVKTKVGECSSKEHDDYCCRATRSRSSSQTPKNFGKLDSSCGFRRGDGGTLKHSTGKSTQPPQPLSLNGGDPDFREAQGPQMSIVRSLPVQNNLELSAVNGEKQSSKVNSAEEYVSRSTGSQEMHSTEEIAKDANSNISGKRINQSRFAASNKSRDAQIAQISAGRSVPIKKDLDLCAANSIGSSDKENVADQYAGRNTSANSEIVLEGSVEATSIASGSNLDGTGLRVGAEVLVPRQAADYNVILKPKQLDFDDVDESCVNGISTPALKKGIQDRSAEKRSISLMQAEDIPDKGMSVNCQVKSISSLEMNFLGDWEVPVKEKELQCGLSKAVAEETYKSRRASNGNVVSSVKETSDAHKNAVANSEKKSSLIDHPTALQVANVNAAKSTELVSEESALDSPAVGKPILSTDADFALVSGPGSFTILDAKNLTVEIPCTASRDETRGNLAQPFLHSHSIIDERDVGHSKSTEFQISEKSLRRSFSSSPQPKRRKIEDKIVDDLSASSGLREEVSHTVNRDSMHGNLGSKEHSPKAVLESQGLSISREDVVKSIVSGNPVEETHQNENSCMIERFESSPKAQRRSFSSSPQHKRRKIEDKIDDDLSASPGLREKASHTVNRGSMGGNLGSKESGPKAVLESQGLSISREDVVKSIVSGSPVEDIYQNEDSHMIERFESSPKAHVKEVLTEDVVKSIVSGSPVEETHQNEDSHMIGRFESSPKAQVKEGEISSEGGDSSVNTPFTFMHEEVGASLLSSLINQAAGHPQDCLVEETRVGHPTSIIVDGGSQCIEDNDVLLPLKDNLRLGNVEHLTCAGRTMQEKRFDLGGTSKLSYYSVGSPHGQSLDLVGADDTMPELEGFVIKPDDEPTSIAGEGINFDELNLPNTTIERASILEQLCKSACMQTPVACSSASYKLHKIPNLYQSVPIGLLEGVDLRTTLPRNTANQLKDGYSFLSEEVGQALYRSSYSDCLSNCSGQSGWDIKKPYTSPVGKLWDRSGLRSSSSGKRGSINPELPCISEENENTDEVADTFEDGIVSEVLNSSIQRVPLADITEIPNPPASVSKVERPEPYADRFSLDSVNTEFSLMGTHRSFKQKLGIQSSSKRRHNNKENQSISRGTNDIKRATGSLRNRFSKPKLSGKTSLRKGGPSLSEREPRPNNIVSNMTSFVPLVRQKQAAAVVTGKRDIKVKALEAAEAAKHLAEKKENERKMKKEALKLERSRMEQKNLRQLELQKNKKEEERKKKEADMAARKRQREEEDRKEKERKRMRVEARRQHREHEDKLLAEKEDKEIKCQAIDGRGHESKESTDETVHKKMEEGSGYGTLRNISETVPGTSRVSTNNARRESIVHEECCEALSNFGYNAEVSSNLAKAIENENWVANTSQEQSYEISPYKESDDENEEDDDIIPNSKFIPSWASKNCLALAVSCQNGVDPEAIFPRESFCSISEVLLPRKH